MAIIIYFRFFFIFFVQRASGLSTAKLRLFIVDANKVQERTSNLGLTMPQYKPPKL